MNAADDRDKTPAARRRIGGLLGAKVEAGGIEPPSKAILVDEKTRNGPAGGAKSGAIDADLAAIVAAWPTLPEALRAGILAMVRSASAGNVNRLA